MQEPISPIQAEPDIRILKIGTCPSLSGLSDLSFTVGIPVDSKDIADACLRISGNSSSGKWNGDSIPISRIDHLLSALPQDQSFTAAAFNPLYPNASSNSPGFMAGICLHLGLISRVSNSRAYVRDSGEMFWAEMETALADGVNLATSSMGHTARNSGGTAKPKPGPTKKTKSVATPNA